LLIFVLLFPAYAASDLIDDVNMLLHESLCTGPVALGLVLGGTYYTVQYILGGML
jgi:hypothetical protein